MEVLGLRGFRVCEGLWGCWGSRAAGFFGMRVFGDAGDTGLPWFLGCGVWELI